MPSESTVIHHPEKFHFEIIIAQAIAKLDYHIEGKQMVITHTFVPEELRGQKLAGQLAKAAFDYARAESLQVMPQCSYIATYAERHPEAKAILKSQN